MSDRCLTCFIKCLRHVTIRQNVGAIRKVELVASVNVERKILRIVCNKQTNKYVTSVTVMPFGEVVCGSPGSGKSTYCYGKHQLFNVLNRPISIVNLDPANENIPYPCDIDISSLITLKDATDTHGLGPNGGMLYCMEYLEANFDWLEENLKDLGPDAYVLFDLPGQVELSTSHDSVKNIINKLTKIGFRVSLFPTCA
jgi:GTPase SAR1 family protein